MLEKNQYYFLFKLIQLFYCAKHEIVKFVNFFFVCYNYFWWCKWWYFAIIHNQGIILRRIWIWTILLDFRVWISELEVGFPSPGVRSWSDSENLISESDRKSMRDHHFLRKKKNFQKKMLINNFFNMRIGVKLVRIVTNKNQA